MSDEQTMTEEPKTEDTQAVDWEQKFKDQETRFKAELAGLNRKNTELSKTLSEKEKEGMSVEERVKAIEAREHEAVRRAEAVEAFAKAGHNDSWRQLFTIKDPVEQAETLGTMLAEYKREISKQLASEYGRNPETALDSSKREYSMEDLKGMDPDKINKLFEEGRVKSG